MDGEAVAEKERLAFERFGRMSVLYTPAASCPEGHHDHVRAADRSAVS